MAQQTINIGNSPNDGTGDPLRTGGQKINQNFMEVYGLLNNIPSYRILYSDGTTTDNDLITNDINNIGLVVQKDQIQKFVIIRLVSSSVFSILEQRFYDWEDGAGSFGTPNGDTITNPRWRLTSVVSTEMDESHDLGEIGTTPIEDVVNNSGPWAIPPNLFLAQRSGEQKVYLYIGTEDLIGLGEAQTTSDDFVDLTDEDPVPPDLTDYVTYNVFNGSLYDTAETGFSADLSNFTSLTEKFYFLRISGEGDTVYFASKETNVEDFVGSRIKIPSITSDPFDLDTPTVTQNGYHFWDIGVLPVTINLNTPDWAFRAWINREKLDLQKVTDKGNETTNDVVVVDGGANKSFSIKNPSGDTLIQMRSLFNGASFFWVSTRDGSGALIQSLQLYTDRIDTLNLGEFLFPDKSGTTDTFAMLSDLAGFPQDGDVLHNTGNETVALKDDTERDIFIGKEFDEGTTAYVSTAELITAGYTTANGYVQGTEIIMRNTGTYTRYEKMSDDDNDWYSYTNANGWQSLPLT